MCLIKYEKQQLALKSVVVVVLVINKKKQYNLYANDDHV
jgi:hypothetical protein